jgi:hypothetical protein
MICVGPPVSSIRSFECLLLKSAFLKEAFWALETSLYT